MRLWKKQGTPNGVPCSILFNRIYRISEMERADLQATSFAGNIDTVHIMLNFENKYLHIQCFLGIFTCENRYSYFFFFKNG